MTFKIKLDYQDFQLLLKNRYFQYDEDWFLDSIDIRNYFFLGEKEFSIFCKDITKFGIKDLNFFLKTIIEIEKKLLFIDIDKKKVGVFPTKLDYSFYQFYKENLDKNHIFGGHNIIDYDKIILEDTQSFRFIKVNDFIDTLYLSIVLIKKTSHRLDKRYKKSKKDLNNPIGDAKESYHLFTKELEIFRELPLDVKEVFVYLLKDEVYFKTFIRYIGLKVQDRNIICKTIEKYINIEIPKHIKEYKVEIAIIFFSKFNNYPIAQFAKERYPKIDSILKEIAKNDNFDSTKYAKKLIDSEKDFKYKDFPAVDTKLKNISQKDIINSTIQQKSILSVLPTGGGKSFCFQIPAIYEAEHVKGLTVVISPIRSLMKDQVVNFNRNFPQTKSGALSGYLSPSEKRVLIDDIENGIVDLIYIAPESLRYQTIKTILNRRYISRIVIDEAHCLSTWGQDFRPDYRYIAPFIKNELNQKNIPISCFTATATKYVLDDIKTYFYKHLQIEFVEFIASSKRENINYSVIKIEKKDDKYSKLLEILNPTTVPAIIYIPTSTKTCDYIADELDLETDFKVSSFHSKTENREILLEQFINDEVDIIVATTAFGMGVDKPNIKTVIHYTSSSNIEDFLQESGRAGRDKEIVPKANSIVLYQESDFDYYLQRLKTDIDTRQEINSIYQSLKKLSNSENRVRASAREIVLEANWDSDDETKWDLNNIHNYQIKINRILAELEDAQLIQRDTNITSPFASSVEISTIEKAVEKLGIKPSQNLEDIDEKLKLQFEIMQLIQDENNLQNSIDELVHKLGDDKKVRKRDIILGIKELFRKDLISDTQDIRLKIVEFRKQYFEIEKSLLKYVENSNEIRIKELISDTSNKKRLIKIYEAILRDWKDNRKCTIIRVDKNLSIWHFSTVDYPAFKKSILTKLFYAEKLFHTLKILDKEVVNISKLKKRVVLPIHIEIDYLLVFLHKIRAIQLFDGRFLFHSSFQIKILEHKPRYTEEIYSIRRKPYYENRRKKYHIMNEYLQQLIQKKDTDSFLENYFILNLDHFTKKFMGNAKRHMKTFVTRGKLLKVEKNLAREQKKIINSNDNSILVLAGPGSGKTKTLVHKIANTILNDESVKPESFLMLTHTRTAVNDFRERLYKLIGNDAYNLDIHTFHSFTNLIIGDFGLQDDINIVQKFNQNISEYREHISPKTAIYLDEFQDVNHDSFELIKNIIEIADIQKIVAVGDDDQIIMDFIGADVKYFDYFWQYFNKNRDNKISQFELINNYRSDKRIVDFSNHFIEKVLNRKKSKKLISRSTKKGKVKLIQCSSEYLYEPIKNEILKILADSNLKNSIAILTHTNDEVLTMQSFLDSFGIKSYLMQSEKDKRFKFKNLFEIRSFTDRIKEKLKSLESTTFSNVLNEMRELYSASTNFYKLEKVVRRFLQHEKLSFSSWNRFIDEIDDSFFETNYKNHNIVITTIHKSKGLEFDNVLILDSAKSWNNSNIYQSIREYYVAITRAKHHLYIFTNIKRKYLNFKKQERFIDKTDYQKPKKVILYMEFGDLNLGASIYYQNNILENRIVSGKNLYKYSQYLKYENITVAKISNISKDNIEKKNHILVKLTKFQNQGYNISNIILDTQAYYFLKYPEKGEFIQNLCKFELKLEELK